MKTNLVMIAALIFMIFNSAVLAAEKYHWKQVEVKDGCQIYTSPVAGKKYVAAKATCLIPARIEILGTILRDIPNFPAWMHDCKETRILKTVDDERDVFIFWYHQHVDLLTDRDMVLKSRTVIDLQNGTNLIYSDSTDEVTYDSGKGYVRMPSFHSLWILQWVDRENTRVSFMIDPDLGPGVPASIANRKIPATPYRTIRNMMKMARQPEYIEAAKKSKYHKMAEAFASGRR